MYALYILYDYNADGTVANRREVPVDTAVLDNKQKWDYIGHHIGAEKDAQGHAVWTPQYVDGPQPIIVIQFKMPTETVDVNLLEDRCPVDGCNSILDPRSSAIGTAFTLGRVITPPPYEDPDNGVPTTPDWEVPGSPIGPPFEDPAKRLYVFKFTNHKEGASYTGASGTVYILVKVITSALGTYGWAWRAQG